MRRLILTLAASTMLTAPVALAQDDLTVAQAIDAPHFVTWMEAYVRAMPDGGSERLATLGFGDTIAVTGLLAGEEWYRVELDDGRIGYVWAAMLAPARMALPGGDGGGGAVELPSVDTGPDVSPDNSFTDANVISDIGPTAQGFTGYVGASDEVDYYVFSLDDWTDVRITLAGLDSDADIALLDADGAYIADSINGGNSSEEIVQTLGAGEYFIEVYIYTGDTDYLMEISGDVGEPPPEDTVGDEAANAEPIGTIEGPEGQIEVSEYVGPADLADYWSIEVLEPVNLTVEMTGLSADIDIVLEDDFGSVMANSAAGGNSDELMTLPVNPGTYYIQVYPYAGASDYTVTVSWTTAGVDIPDDGAGNSPDQAADLGTLGDAPLTAGDWVGPADVSDYYVFEVTEAGPVTITMQPATSDADVELLSMDQAYIDGSIAPGTDGEEIIADLQPGRYLVRAYIFSGDTTYELEISR